jgi:hypothetical protein
MKNLAIVDMTPAHRFGADFADDAKKVAEKAFDDLKSKERVSDIKDASVNKRGERKESGASIRADLSEVSLTVEQIAERYAKDNKTRANLIKRKEREMQARNEKNLADFVVIGKALRGFQIQAEYQKDGETLINNSVLESVLESFDLSHYSRGQRRAYIVVYQRETELDALEAWRVSTAKKRIKPLHELDADSIRKAFDAYDKAQQSASESESDTDSSDTNSKSDTLDKIVKNALTRADKLGIEKAELIRAIQSAQI